MKTEVEPGFETSQTFIHWDNRALTVSKESLFTDRDTCVEESMFHVTHATKRVFQGTHCWYWYWYFICVP